MAAGGADGGTVDMEGAARQEDRGRKALDHVRAALDKQGKLSEAMRSCLDGIAPDSPVESWDRLAFELGAMDEPTLAEKIAHTCRDKRLAAWRAIGSDDALLSQVRPMCDQFEYAGADATESLRFKLAAMADSVHEGFIPGDRVSSFVINMARFGSTVDDRTIRAIVEELYVRRLHLDRACGICEGILWFTGRDRRRMASSTLVEDTVGAVLSEVWRLQSRAYAFSVESRILPLLAHTGENPGRWLLDRCEVILVRRATSLGLPVPVAPRADLRLLWASALARRISARTQEFSPGEIARSAKLRHPRSYGFLRLSRAATVSALGKRGHSLVESASSALAAQGLAEVRGPPDPGQDALGILDALLGHMERHGVAVSPDVAKRWRAGLRGSRLWGSLLEMEAHLRLRIAGAAPVPRPGGHGVALELAGCRVEFYSPLDDWPSGHGGPARAGSPAHKTGRDMFGQARRAGEAGRVVAVVDCTALPSQGMDIIAGALAPALALGEQPGALFFVRRELGLYERKLLKNPHSAPGIPGLAMGHVERAFGLDLAGRRRPAP